MAVSEDRKHTFGKMGGMGDMVWLGWLIPMPPIFHVISHRPPYVRVFWYSARQASLCVPLMVTLCQANPHKRISAHDAFEEALIIKHRQAF